MRQIRPASRALCALVAFAAIATTRTASGQPPASQPDAEFRQLEVRGGGTVSVDFGPVSRAALDDAPANALKLSVHSGTLRVECPRPCTRNRPGVVRVTVPALTSIRLTGGGHVEIREGFPPAPAIAVEIHGGGTVQAARLSAESVTATIQGGGAATVSATRRLNGEVRGGGSIRYFGDPEVVAKTRGGGTIRRLGSPPKRQAHSSSHPRH